MTAPLASPDAPEGITIVRPQSRAEWLAGRMATIGGSELPTLFGVNKYQTPYELFALKSGLITKEAPEIEIRENSIHVPPMGRGNIFEDDAIDLVRLLRPDWTVEPNTIPGGRVFVDRAARMSTTPDAFIHDPRRSGKGRLQIKSMAQMVFDREWKVDGEIAPPDSALIQAIDDATLSDGDYAYVGAFVANFNIDFYLIEVPLHPQLMVKARALVADFWRRVAENDPYPPEFSRDGALVAQLWGGGDGGTIDLSADAEVVGWLDRRAELSALERIGRVAAEERKEQIDARLYQRLGNASSATVGHRKVEAKWIKRRGYTVEPSEYPQLKVK